jgi:hypothetical protein
VTRRYARPGRYCATALRKIFGAENLGACGLRSRRSQRKSRCSSFGFLRRTNNDGRGLSMGRRSRTRAQLCNQHGQKRELRSFPEWPKHGPSWRNRLGKGRRRRLVAPYVHLRSLLPANGAVADPEPRRSPGNALKPKLVNGSQFPGAQPTLWHALSPRHIRVQTSLASFASCAFSAGPPAAVFWT